MSLKFPLQSVLQRQILGLLLQILSSNSHFQRETSLIFNYIINQGSIVMFFASFCLVGDCDITYPLGAIEP